MRQLFQPRRLPLASFASLASFTLTCVAAVFAQAAFAQGTYPSKPIRFVVAVAPGGGADILARTVGGKLNQHFGQPVVVENISGASGLLAYHAVQKAPADAHTIIINTSSTYNATMYARKIGDPKTALAPVAQLTSQPLVMIINNALPIRNMKDLVEYGKKNPDGLAFASPGIGTSSHLVGAMINQKTGINLVHVPYKGIAPGIIDAIAGRIQIVFTSPTSAGPQVRAGKLRMIAHSGPKRTVGMPDVPTMAEQGVDIDWVSWFGIFTTYGSPRQSIATLNAAINQAAATPEMQKMFAADGADPAPRTPEQFGATVSTVLETGERLIKEMGLKLAE
jgi:tripartite-type tricarboxylate transporter receptor subunit TctC